MIRFGLNLSCSSPRTDVTQQGRLEFRHHGLKLEPIHKAISVGIQQGHNLVGGSTDLHASKPLAIRKLELVFDLILEIVTRKREPRSRRIVFGDTCDAIECSAQVALDLHQISRS